MRMQRFIFLGFFLFALNSFGASENLLYVAQPKSVMLVNRFELVLSGLYNLNNRYVGESGLSLAGIYHINEVIALELQGSWLLNRANSDLFQKIMLAKNNEAFSLARYYRSVWNLQALVRWNVIYGKISFYDFVLGDLGIYFLAGLGFLGLELVKPDLNSAKPVHLKGHGVLSSQFTTPFGFGLALYFLQHFSIRFEIRDNIQVVWTEKNTGGYDIPLFNISHKMWAMLGVGYVF